MNVGVLDYGAGNLRSVLNALKEVGHPATLVTQPGQFDSLDLLVFPGQGAFGDCVRQMGDAALLEPLKRWVVEKRPYLGFCLGYQLLFESGAENPGVPGLAVFQGTVPRFPSIPGVKVPHMGWNNVRLSAPDHPAWRGLPADPSFYFVHSYFPEPKDPALVGCRTGYAGIDFASGIVGENFVAVQFHPEKSQRNGLTLLKNALEFLY
jgi:glutamine amidotransferase